MMERLISAIVALAIFIPIFIIGGSIYNIAILVLSVLALKEFLSIIADRNLSDLKLRIINNF